MSKEKAETDPRIDAVKRALSERAFLRTEEHRMVSETGGPLKWFFDFRSVLLDGEVLDAVSSLMWEKLKAKTPFQIGGLETASLPITAGVVLKAKQEGVHVNGFYIRKSRKKNGLQRIIEGTLTRDDVVLVDDGINSGKSIIRQMKLLELHGLSVKAVCVIVRFRDPSFYRYFEEAGIEVLSLFTLDDFPMTGGVKAYMAQHSKEKAPHLAMPFKVEWKFESDNPNYFHILPKSAPVIDETRVYFGADNGSLWALNQRDGSVAWRHKTLFGAGTKRIFSSTALSRGALFFGSYDGNFYALDAENGSVRWIYREADWIGSSPCVAEDLGLVCIGLEFGLFRKHGGLVALDAQTGEKRWWAPVETHVHSSPVYSPKHGIVVVGSTHGSVYALDAKRGTFLWEMKTGAAVRASFAFDDTHDLVCFGSEDKHIYALDVKTGRVVHAIETLEPVYSTPLVDKGKLYMGLFDKRHVCVDLSNGALVWAHWTQSRVYASPVLVDGVLLIGSNDGRLYELNPNTGEETAFFQAEDRIVNKIAYNEKTRRYFVPTYANELYCLSRGEDPTTSA